MIRSPFGGKWYYWRHHYWPEVFVILGSMVLAFSLTGIETRPTRGIRIVTPVSYQTTFPIANRIGASLGAGFIAFGLLARKPDSSYGIVTRN